MKQWGKPPDVCAHMFFDQVKLWIETTAGFYWTDFSHGDTITITN